MPIKLVYVAGSYRSATRAEIDTNISKARELGKSVARLGAYPVIPHANTGHFEGCEPEGMGEGFWLRATLELCRRCDAIVSMRGWRKSSGTLIEIDTMRKLGKPIFFATSDDHVPSWSAGTLPELAAWIKK
jgi:nucleoside 2-deoxyribosyltransferase